MSLFKRLIGGLGKVAGQALPIAAPLLGTAFGGPVGGLIGGSLGGMLGGGGGGRSSPLGLAALPGLPGPGVPAGSPAGQFGGGFGVGYDIGQQIGGALARRRQSLSAGGAPGTVMLPSHTPAGSLPGLGVYGLGSARRMRFNAGAANDFYMQYGVPPPGWHNTRTGNIARNRHMNPLNPRALRRALRRAHSFAKFAKRAITITHHPAAGVRFKGRFGGRRKARA